MSSEMRSVGAPPQAQRRQTERRRGDRRRPALRIAAVGDFHCGEEDVGRYRAAFSRVNQEADMLLLAGDLTRWGTPAEMRVAVGELADVAIPIVAVLGNHDHESGEIEEVSGILRERGIQLLDGDTFVLNEQVGVAGVKGFMGGFGPRTLTAFGESATKHFVKATLEEVKKLELSLRRLPTPIRVVLMHYAPIVDTVLGEPEQIYCFLGNDRLAEPLDRYGASVAFHGHAHTGAFHGSTPGGVPVFNVCHALLQAEGIGEMYYVHEIAIPPEEGAEKGEVEERRARAVAEG